MADQNASTKYGAKQAVAAFGIGIVLTCCSGAALTCRAEAPAQTRKEVRSCPPPSDISLTVYNNGLGLVKDVRSLELASGINLVRCEDIAAKIEPASVSLHCLSAPNTVAIKEQSYQYDLLNPATILSKSIGKQIKIKHFLASGSSEEISGILLSAPMLPWNGPLLRAPIMPPGGANVQFAVHEGGAFPFIDRGLVLKTSNAIVLNPIGQVELSELPEGLVSKPSLLWKLEASKAGKQTVELAYQTEGLNWHCDYIFVVDKDGADLNAWVTLDNQSGADYKNANLKLVAGNVHRVHVRPPAPPRMMMAMAAGDSPMPMQAQFNESPLADYHIYSLHNKTDISDNETKQLALFSASKITTQKVYIFDADAPPLGFPLSDDPEFKSVKAKLEFINSDANNLGITMPAGKVRVYKYDDDGALQLIGEDKITHTPKDEKVRLFLGDSAGIIARRTQTNVQQTGAKTQRLSYEITLRNHTDADATVTDVEHAPPVWKIISSSMPYTKKDSRTFEFAASVPANGETKIDYTIETRSY